MFLLIFVVVNFHTMLTKIKNQGSIVQRIIFFGKKITSMSLYFDEKNMNGPYLVVF
jgi:hypothetical protein